MPPPVYHTVKEVAAALRSSPRTIRDWIEHGCPTPQGRVRLEAAKLGKRWFVKDEWLVLFEARVRPQPRRPDLDPESTTAGKP